MPLTKQKRGQAFFSSPLKPKLDHFNIFGILSEKKAHRRSWACDVNRLVFNGDASGC
jgi:hypothetical protein